MEEWKTYKLGDLVNLYSGGTPNKSKAGYWGGSIPWISAKSMYEDFLSTSDLFITESGLKAGSKLAKKDTILLLTRGSGLFNRIPVCWTERDLAFNQDVKNIVSKDDSVLLNQYLYYWLYGNKAGITAILETTGIGAGKIDTERFLSLDVSIPSVDEQNRIIRIVEPIFDKIAINNRINHNLEEQAQALYKSWFVDFEPFIGGKFVDSELGMIPEGWHVGTLSELLEVRYGKDHKALKDGNTPVFGSGGLMRYAERALYNGESVLIPRKGTLNNVMYFNGPFWTVDTMFYTVERSSNVIKYCHLFLLTQDLASMNAGSAVPSMTTDILNNLPLLIPSSQVLEAFNRVLSSIYEARSQREEESNSLSQSRDTILPQLMSGALTNTLLTC